MTGGHEPGGRAGHESDPDFVDKDIAGRDDAGRDLDPALEREGEYVDQDVDPSLPESTREGDYTDKDVPDDDPDTPPGSYVRSDPPP